MQEKETAREKERDRQREREKNIKATLVSGVERSMHNTFSGQQVFTNCKGYSEIVDDYGAAVFEHAIDYQVA